MSELERTKTVTVVGYLKEEDELSLRELLNYLFETDKFTQTTWEESTEYFLDDGNYKDSISKSNYEKMQGGELGKHTTKVTKKVENHETATNEAAGWVFDKFWEPLPDEWGGCRKSSFINYKYKDEDNNTPIKVWTYVDTIPLLKHQSQWDEDEPYVDENEKFPVVKYKFTLQDSDELTIETLNEQIVEPFVEYLAKHNAVARVRTADCEVETVEKGVCMNL